MTEQMSGQTPMTTITGYPEPALPPRRIRVGHLVVGLVFLGLAGTWALRASGSLDGVPVALAVPTVLIVAGALGLVAMTFSRPRRAASTYASEPEAEPTLVLDDTQQDTHESPEDPEKKETDR